MINARAETVATSRPFGASFARRRCLVPAEGWYEWLRQGQGQGQGQGRQRQRQVLHDPRDGAVDVHGVWSAWRPADGC
jgi:putative SOS response-associated peptidase YedK